MIRINNISAIVGKYNSKALDDLVLKYPDKEKTIRGDSLMGIEDNSTQIGEETEYLAEVETTIISLKVMRQRIEVNLEKLKKRYTKIKTLKLFAATVTLLTSVSLVSEALNNQDKMVIVIVSLLNLIPSIFLLIANSLDSPSIDGKRNLADFFNVLNSIFSEAEKIETQLIKLVNRKEVGEKCLPLIEKADNLAFEFSKSIREQIN